MLSPLTMKQSRTSLLWLAPTVVLAALGSFACEGEKAAPQQAPPPVATAPANSPKPAEASKGEASEALASYERIRASLANDAIDTIADDAADLERISRSVAKQNTSQATHWTALADAAKELHAIDKSDGDAVRKAFGEASSHVVGILSREPRLAKGLHVFECPMAQGYKKWVQADEKISNPYMGSRMPACGSKSEL